MKSEPILVTVIGGYLGCGKTSLVNHALNNADGKNIAVLVNDFGQLSIDSELIDAEDGNIVELSGGCICCSYGDDLSMALLDILALSKQPEHIIIETSGVALPGAIASNLTLFRPLQLHSVLVLVDAESIREQAIDKYIGDTVHRQIQDADLLVINKSDLVKKSTVDDIITWLADNYPALSPVITEQAKLPLGFIFDVAPEHRNIAQPFKTFSSQRPHSGNASPENHASSLFQSFTLDVSEMNEPQILLNLLMEKSLFLVRAK